MKINQIKYVSDLISKFQSEQPSRSLLYFKISDTTSVETELKNLGVAFESIHDGLSIELSDSNFGIKAFYNEEDFLRSATDDIFQSDFVLLKYGSSYLHYDSSANTVNNNFGLVSNDFLIPNTKAYHKLIICLKEKYSDYENELNNELVYYTSTRGIFRIYLPKIPPLLDIQKDITTDIYKFINKSQNDSFLIFIKNKLFDYSKETNEQQLKEILLKLELILESSERDFEIHLKNFSFDTLINDLRKKKDEYFSSNRDLLSKILSQIISFPVSVSAALFALNKIENQLFYVFIVLSFAIYVFYVIHVELVYLIDIKLLKDQLEVDFKIIIEKSGLEFAEIDNGRNTIRQKLKNTEITLISFAILFTIASFIFLFILKSVLPLYDTLIFLIIFSLLIALIIRCREVLFGFEKNDQ